jgi:ubiquitin carboxyl-terminal hydrolase 9/24
LPKFLCIQLKRFDYDWESNRSIKFDDYFQFPRNLNVSPYMYESINKSRDSISLNINEQTDIDAETFNLLKEKEILYDLVGIVVHSGQANAGHYYSFIKGNKNNQ